MKIKFVLVNLFILLNCYVNGQDIDVFHAQEEEINWTQYPEFNLPFTVIYGGPVPSNGEILPLKRGFSHISGDTRKYEEVIPKNNRVYLWTGISGADGWAQRNNQPWELAKIPWDNDIVGYRKAWWNRLQYVNKTWHKYDSSEKGFDIVIADIEKTFLSSKEILSIKRSSLVPELYRNLSDDDFIDAYQTKMRELYNEPIQLLKDSIGEEQKVSSYSDTPISREWWGIRAHDWEVWKSDKRRLNFLIKDDNGLPGSLFYHNLDYLSPSSYYFYDPERNSEGNNYLAYLLFQIEANREWSDKEQILFIWLNFHESGNNSTKPISPEMAEASAIFPLMSGIGIYNWWKPGDRKGNFDYFLRGLYRISKYACFFDGNEVYLKPTNSRDEFVNKSAIWRGVVNNNKLLVAAHNSFAHSNERTSFSIRYKGADYKIELVGNENKLIVFNIP